MKIPQSFVVFIDVAKVFDSLNRKRLFETLQDRGVGNLSLIMRQLFEDKTFVKTDIVPKNYYYLWFQFTLRDIIGYLAIFADFEKNKYGAHSNPSSN